MTKTPLFPITLIASILIFILISGCGHSSVNSADTNQPPTLMSIAVIPAARSFPLGATHQQFHATGTYSNGTSIDLTNSVAWSSSDATVATITAAGVLSVPTSATVGNQPTISASLGGITTSIVLTITPNVFTIWSTNVKPAHPVGVAVDGTGNVYIADAFSNNSSMIRKYTSSGNLTTPPPLVATTLPSNVVGVAVAPFGNYSGKVYVTDYNNNRLNIFSQSGTPLTALTTPAPAGVAVDSSGNIYVTDAVNNYLHKYNSSGALITSWSTIGVPSGVAVDPSSNVYVADFSERMIRTYTSVGAPITSWSTTGTPIGVAVDPTGTNVYVVDTYYYMLREYNTSGTPSQNGPWSTSGWPNAVAVDPSGNVYVVDASYNVVRIYKP